MAVNKSYEIVQAEDVFTKKYFSFMHEAVDIAVFVLITVFPLVFHNSYYDILETKYHCYSRCILILLGISFIFSFVILTFDLYKYHGAHTKILLQLFHPKNWKKLFGVTDIAALAFWIIAGISTLQSDFVHEAFWGNYGRYSGFLLITLYVASYFLISRFWIVKEWIFELFLATGMIACLFGITDYFQMDILHFRTPQTYGNMQSFTSTFGNINTYTAYVGIIMGFSAALFATEKSLKKLLWHYFCLIISFVAIITGRSDNAYLSIIALFAVLPFILFSQKEGVKRYLIIIASFFTVIWGLYFINQIYSDKVIGIHSLFNVITSLGILPFIVILLWAVVILFMFYSKKINSDNLCLVPVWGILILISVTTLIFMFFDANALGNAERYGSLGSYLVFNDSWGSHRGYLWRKSLWMYNRLSPMHKFFGYGPDTYGCLVNKTVGLQMSSELGSLSDNAHNSFLNYLITLGISGLAAYLAFLGSSFWKLLQNKKKSPYILGVFFATLCYTFQSLINFDLPIVTPFLWLLLAMGTAYIRQK